jgi:hypothetical protein
MAVLSQCVDSRQVSGYNQSIYHILIEGE